MAVLRIPDENRSLREHGEVRDYLAGIGINYERWESPVNLPADASADQVLSAYGEQIEKLKRQGGYVTADVIDVNSDTPGLDAMLAKFSIEHTHDEDEVRYIVAGRGLFHIHPSQGPVVAIEVEAGDLIPGRPITRAVAWTGTTNPFAGVPDTFRRKRRRNSRRASDRRTPDPRHSAGHRRHDNSRRIRLPNAFPLCESQARIVSSRELST